MSYTEDYKNKLREYGDDVLHKLWETPLCFQCDYSGLCECWLAGMVLVERGHVIQNKKGQTLTLEGWRD